MPPAEVISCPVQGLTHILALAWPPLGLLMVTVAAAPVKSTSVVLPLAIITL